MDIPASDDKIYDEINESPLTIVSGSNPDYEDGYILNVESVPRKPSRSFGKSQSLIPEELENV
jgi:hypothetical protein